MLLVLLVLLQVGLLLTYILGQVQEVYGGHDEADTARKMLVAANNISGGIEMA
jgi:hypothetical protein